jgi:hypothetical protein
MSKGPKYRFSVRLTTRCYFETAILARDEDEAFELAKEEFFAQLDPEFDLDLEPVSIDVEDEDDIVDEEDETDEDNDGDDLSEIDPDVEPEAEAAE